MKRITTILMLLMLVWMGAGAAVTDLPQITSDANSPKLYVIKNTNSKKYVAYRGDTEQMRQISDISAASLWYFTAGDGESTAEKKCVRVFNYLSGHAISGRKTNSFNATGNDVWIKAHTSGNGVAIDLFNTFNNANATALNK